MNKKLIIPIAGTLILMLLWVFTSRETGDPSEIFISPKTGEFTVLITSSGELRARSSLEIMGPTGARDVGIFQLRIQEMVPEGTVVSRGDYVADLDRTDLHTRLQSAELQLQRVQSQYEQAQLDSSLTLTQARNSIENLEFQVEERQIALDQSIYESPAVQRQAQIDLERTSRQYEQEIANYNTRRQQAEARLREIQADLTTESNMVARIRALDDAFTIRAPADGMVVYNRDRRGQRTAVGSTISVQNPIVAELPDFTAMESVTYINEVDIRNVNPGQTVTLGLDADRDKRLTGVVVSVANIGEQRANSDARVFEVVVRINESDTSLRPTMTTSNRILIHTVPEAIYLPLETVHLIDEQHFVYKRQGSQKVLQQVLMGPMNENDVVIMAGISESDQVLLSMAPSPEGLSRVMIPEDVYEEQMEELEQMEMEMETLGDHLTEDRQSPGQPDSLRSLQGQRRAGGGFDMNEIEERVNSGDFMPPQGGRFGN